jgi:hypothetical protein
MRGERGDDRNEQRGGSLLVVPENALVIVPIRNTVLFPGMILPLTIARESVDPGRAAGGQDRAAGRESSCSGTPRVEQPTLRICTGSARWPTSCAT